MFIWIPRVVMLSSSIHMRKFSEVQNFVRCTVKNNMICFSKKFRAEFEIIVKKGEKLRNGDCIKLEK